MSLFYVLWFCWWCTLFFNILNSVSSGTVLTRRTYKSWHYGGNAVLSWGMQADISETQPHLSLSKTGQEPGQNSSVPGAPRPTGRLFLFPSKLCSVPCGLAWLSLGERCWCKGERRLDLHGGREREGWRRGRISIQASQQGYKDFIKSERNVFSLYHLLLELWCNEIAFSQITIEGS